MLEKSPEARPRSATAAIDALATLAPTAVSADGATVRAPVARTSTRGRPLMLGILAALVIVAVPIVAILGRSSGEAREASHVAPPLDRAAAPDAAVMAAPALPPDADVAGRPASRDGKLKSNATRGKKKDDLEDLPPTYRSPAP